MPEVGAPYSIALFYTGTANAGDFLSQQGKGNSPDDKIDYMPKETYGVGLTTTFIEGTFQNITIASGKAYNGAAIGDILGAKKPYGKRTGVSLSFGVDF